MSLTDPGAMIRQLYRPLQPTVSKSSGKVSYHEFWPNARLQPFIYCYWQLKTEQALDEPFMYRVVADGCIDIFFELNAPQENFIMGFCKKYTEFPLEHQFNYVGIRFLPTMFPQLFKVDASALSNRFERLQLVVPAVSQFLAGRVQGHESAETLKAIFDDYFLKLVSASKFDNDPRLYGALQLILNSCGVIDVELGLDTGISPRQLQRLFKFYVGSTAKTFSQVVRFQNILSAKPSQQSLRQNKLFFDAGYYDQAHFIREFKTFYGVTPGKAFGR